MGVGDGAWGGHRGEHGPWAWEMGHGPATGDLRDEAKCAVGSGEAIRAWRPLGHRQRGADGMHYS